jgi:YVTN family beta-propeller protein
VARLRTLAAALAAGLLCLAVLAPGGAARQIFVVNYGSQNVAVVDSLTGQPVGPPISIKPESGPYTIAITPNGRTAYAVNYNSGTVSVIDAQTRTLAGSPIPVGSGPIGIGITPDGSRAFVANAEDDTVSVIDIATAQVVGPPIEVGGRPQGVAITPDGRRAFIANNDDDTVSVVDTLTSQVIGGPIAVGANPFGIAITPDGSRVFTANDSGESVSVIDTQTSQVIGGPIPLGSKGGGIAISPDGARAYVGAYSSDSVVVVDTRTFQVTGAVAGLEEAEFVALMPDGRSGYVSSFGPGTLTGFDTGTLLSAAPLIVGEATGQLAIVPNQPPVASFATPKRVRPRVPAKLNASATVDPDGAPAAFAWSFGDGNSAVLGAPGGSHAFARPGRYQVTLTVTDNEGCSNAFVITGQTASCNGSAIASQTRTVRVAFPGLRVRCPKSAGKAGCRFSVQAVSRRPTKRKPKAKPKSAVSRVKAKAGKKAIVSIKPKKKFRKGLAGAKRILVRETRRISGKTRTRYVRLKVVR